MQDPSEPTLPLAGLRVIDLTLARAGPTCVPPFVRLGCRRHPDRNRHPAMGRTSRASGTGRISRTCTATNAACG